MKFHSVEQLNIENTACTLYVAEEVDFSVWATLWYYSAGMQLRARLKWTSGRTGFRKRISIARVLPSGFYSIFFFNYFLRFSLCSNWEHPHITCCRNTPIQWSFSELQWGFLSISLVRSILKAGLYDNDLFNYEATTGIWYTVLLYAAVFVQ